MPSLLPPNPSLRHLKLQVDDLLRGFAAGEAEAQALVAEHDAPDTPRSAADSVASGRLTRVRAQLVVARRYGFASWPKLKHCGSCWSGAATRRSGTMAITPIRVDRAPLGDRGEPARRGYHSPECRRGAGGREPVR